MGQLLTAFTPLRSQGYAPIRVYSIIQAPPRCCDALGVVPQLFPHGSWFTPGGSNSSYSRPSRAMQRVGGMARLQGTRPQMALFAAWTDSGISTSACTTVGVKTVWTVALAGASVPIGC